MDNHQQNDTPCFWHVIAYDDTGRVAFNADVRDKARTEAEIQEWCSTHAGLKDWGSYYPTRK